MGNVEQKGLGRSVSRVISAALMVYGALGVVVQLRLLPLLAEGVGNWTGLKPSSAAPVIPAWLIPVQGHFDGLPWLPWAAWLVGVGLLAGGVRLPTTTVSSQATWGLRGQVPIVLLLLVAVGGYVRMVELWPQAYGLSQRPYDDEGVYAGTSQLFLQGIMPYRDYFFAHPPVAAIAYAPAMAYHFNEWGSPTSFMIARYLSVAYSLFTLILIFFVALRLVGLWGGVISSGLWALDGRVVEINRKVMLEGPMVLLSCAALVLYVWVRPTLAQSDDGYRPRRTLLVLSVAGACAALSALTKIAGAACMVAIAADMIWLAFERRRARSVLGDVAVPGFRLQIGSFLGGVFAATILVLGPFLALAPSQFVRDAFFFQLLRPSDGVSDIPARIANLSSTLANPLTLVFAALGFLALTVRAWRYRVTGPWRVVALWTFFSLILFTYSRSFYGHYYIQFAAPLCLLAAGVSLRPGLWRGVVDSANRVWPTWVGAVLPALLALVLLPLLAVQWLGVTADHSGHDRIFEVVGRYVSDAVPPGAQALTTDEQFNFLAARPPSRNSTGYLVDSYGHMIALGLGLGTRSWADLWSSVLRGEHSDDAYAMIRRPTPQADFLDRVSLAPLAVVHDKGFARLTPQTVAAIDRSQKVVEQTTRYTIYRAEGSSR